MNSNKPSERLIRLEEKMDFLIERVNGLCVNSKARYEKLEGRVWSLVVLSLTTAIGLVSSFLFFVLRDH